MPSHPRRVLLVAVAAALPAILTALLLLWRGDFTLRLQWTLTLVIAVALLLGLLSLHERVVRPLQTLSNVLAALREGDYSLRARGADSTDDSLGLVYLEANQLADTLRGQRLGVLEATGLVRAVLAEIDAAVYAFDDQGVLRLVNRGGERLLGQPAERLLGRGAAALGLEACLTGESPRVVEHPAGQGGRWELRRSGFRQEGRPHQLVLLTDVGRTLQAEERQAWQRLVRVLSHEINNSLAPIRSLAGSLRSILDRGAAGTEAQTDLRQGLEIIGQRSEALGRFMAAYARLARLPRPVRRPVLVAEWVGRVAALERRLAVRVEPGPSLLLQADGDQLDQLLINLVQNAVDATYESGCGVTIGWRREGARLVLEVLDEGPGVGETANLFVPFFTTKPGGSGIGLALSRQIAEAHGGSITLANRDDRRGARARLLLPLTGGELFDTPQARP
ncbi:MAG: PAS domain-containing sensor histidine kinase [Gemmatimonadetes bacterium]|nr:PAS domain-containing sensor histidine kinase [Gemmatimonadota bacterium]MBK7784079.1 PAS domain-containing sensor histidine kinase [Gemmatimonadota bacterium]MBK9067874.1 PAS domain-containing sensor histidine kinase [Gemmatimonadota bacterium]